MATQERDLDVIFVVDATQYYILFIASKNSFFPFGKMVAYPRATVGYGKRTYSSVTRGNPIGFCDIAIGPTESLKERI